MSSGFSLLGSSEEEGVGSGRRLHDELIESHASTTSSDDSGTGGLGEAQRAHGELRHLVHTLVIGDLADDNGNLAVLVRHVLDEPRDRDGRLVAAGHVQALADDLVELRVRAAGEELVQLAEQTRHNNHTSNNNNDES